MKFRHVLISLLLVVGVGFTYYYVTHRHDECATLSDCYRSFSNMISEHYQIGKDKVKSLFSSCGSSCSAKTEYKDMSSIEED